MSSNTTDQKTLPAFLAAPLVQLPAQVQSAVLPRPYQVTLAPEGIRRPTVSDKDPGALIRSATAMLKSKAPGAVPAAIREVMLAAMIGFYDQIKPEDADGLDLISDLCTDIIDGRKATEFDPVQIFDDEGNAQSRRGARQMTSPLWKGIALLALAGECTWLLQPKNERSKPDAYRDVILAAEKRMRFQLNEVLPERNGVAQEKKHNMNAPEISARDARLMALCDRFLETGYCQKLAAGKAGKVGRYASNVYIYKLRQFTALAQQGRLKPTETAALVEAAASRFEFVRAAHLNP